MATRIETPYTGRARYYSSADGFSIMITPPADTHSHHNDGDHLARFLIVQDGGLHYHTRTMGFSDE